MDRTLRLSGTEHRQGCVPTTNLTAGDLGLLVQEISNFQAKTGYNVLAI